MIEYYILNDDNTTSPASPHSWLMSMGSRRHVAKKRIGDVLVSTVFLGLNHRWGGGPPLIFETMIFGGEHDEYQERYSTWQEAEAGHKRAVDMVTAATA